MIKKMDDLTDNQWKKIIKKNGCKFNPLHIVRGEYADTPLYLRLYIELLERKKIFEILNRKKLCDSRVGLHICEKHPEDCYNVVESEEIEKALKNEKFMQ